MGNCHREKLTESNIDIKIFEAIKQGSTHRVTSFLTFYSTIRSISILDNLQTKHKGVTANPLGYCLLLNKPDLFSLLLNHNSDPLKMEKSFSITQFHTIEFLVQKNYVEILKIYFPIYQTIEAPMYSSLNSYSLAFSNSFKCATVAYPIHIACIKGFLGVVEYFFSFFQGKASPVEYDIETREENTGENAALLACRYGHLDLVKFLHLKAGADFGVLNQFKENALIVTIAAMNKNPSYKFVNVFKYLLDEVKMDPIYLYEEAVVLAKCKAIYNLLAERLKRLGISVDPKEFDETSFVYADPNDESIFDPSAQIFTHSFIENSKFPHIKSVPSSIYASIRSTNSKNSDFF